MLTAAYLTTSFVVGGVGAYYLLRGKYVPHARLMLGMATLVTSIMTPAQVMIGDLHGLNTLQYQPAKVAAMEGLWEDERGAALRLFALPNVAEQKNDWEIKIPYLSGLILTHSFDGEIKGLKSFPNEQPPVATVFFAFRIMVGIGLLMFLLSWLSGAFYLWGKLFEFKLLQRFWVVMGPSGFIALLAGWFVTEIGRQPYTVYGVLRTIHSVTPGILGPQVAFSLAAFVIIYTFVFGSGLYYIFQLISQGVIPGGDTKPKNIDTKTKKGKAEVPHV
jgi:cytochrome d ubiquinol oxidase subunit I